MSAGTIYMYYARGGDSFNVSCHGEGNAVLLKSGIAAEDNPAEVLSIMQAENPIVNRRNGEIRERPVTRLCSGQTLLCKSMALKVTDWRGKNFDPAKLYMEDTGYRPAESVVAPRRGIPQGRDGHLPLRLIDMAYVKSTNNERV